jgi:hypothetical protein
MLFGSYNKVNKLVLLRRELYPVPSHLFKTVLINLTKYSIVLLYALVIYKKVKVINKPYKVYSYTKELFVLK